MIVTLSSIKAHLRIVGTSDDELLGDYIEAAEDYVRQFVDPMPDPVPAGLKQAVRLLVANFYEHREDTIVGLDARQLPIGFWDLVNQHRWQEPAA